VTVTIRVRVRATVSCKFKLTVQRVELEPFDLVNRCSLHSYYCTRTSISYTRKLIVAQDEIRIRMK
jgi:hypothetical protein